MVLAVLSIERNSVVTKLFFSFKSSLAFYDLAATPCMVHRSKKAREDNCLFDRCHWHSGLLYLESEEWDGKKERYEGDIIMGYVCIFMEL